MTLCGHKLQNAAIARPWDGAAHRVRLLGHRAAAGEGTGVDLVGKGELISTEDIAVIQVGVMVAGIKGMVASGQKWVDSRIFERI